MKTRPDAKRRRTAGGLDGHQASFPAHPVLALQSTVGNTATSALIARFKKPGAPRPIGLNVAEFIAAHAPRLLGVLEASELKGLQERHDVEAENKDVTRRANEYAGEYQKRTGLTIYGPGGNTQDYNADREIKKIQRGYRQVPDVPTELTVDTAKLLGTELTAYAGRNPLERSFREKLQAELVQKRTRVILDEHEDRVNMYWGDVRIWHDRGRVGMKELLGSPEFAQRHNDEVANAPLMQELRAVLDAVAAAIGDVSVEHRLRVKANEDHPIVRRIAEWLGGPSVAEIAAVMIDAKKNPEKGSLEQRMDALGASCPPMTIWEQPRKAAETAYAALRSDEIDAAIVGAMTARNLTQRAVERYVAYEERVLSGAGKAVWVLDKLKVGGKIAASIAALPLGPGGQALVAGGYSAAQGTAQQLSEVHHGLRESVDVAGIAKQAGIEGVMTYFGGQLQGAFGNAIKTRFADKLLAYPALKEHGINIAAAVTSAPYTALMNQALAKIADGKLPVPASLDELADMVAEEAAMNAVMEVGMGAILPGGSSAHGKPGDPTATRPPAPDAPKLPQGPGSHPTTDPRTTAPDPSVRPDPAASGTGGPVPVGVGAGTTAPGGTAPPAADPRAADLVQRVHETPRNADSLIDHFGSWEDAIGHLTRGTGAANGLDAAARAKAVDALVARRQQVVGEVKQFGAAPAEKTPSTEPGSDVDLNVSGDDAGLRVAQASEYLDANHAGWQKRFRMGLMVDARRIGGLASAMADLPASVRRRLSQRQTLATEAYLLAREARSAPTPEARKAVLDRIGDPQLRKKAEWLAGLDPEAVRNERLRLLAHSDRAVAAVDPRSPAEARAEQIQEAMDTQMLINALDPDAYVGPGAIRGVVLGEALPPNQRYQAVIEQVSMIQHLAHGPGGMRAAMRRYETFKYIQRICDQLTAAGVKDPRIKFLRNQAELVYNVDRGAASSAGDRTVGGGDLTSKATSGKTSVAYDDLGSVRGVSDAYLDDVHAMLRGVVDDHVPKLRAAALGPDAKAVASPIRLPALEPAVGGVRGVDVYASDPTTKIELGSKDWNREIQAIGRSRIHGARLGAVDIRSVDRATIDLEVPRADGTGSIRVAVELELKPGAALPEGPHTATGGSGPARVELTAGPAGGPDFVAKIHLDQHLMPENLRFVLGHELDEIAATVRRGRDVRFGDQNVPGIFIEAAHGAPGGPRGAQRPMPTAHDLATAREYLDVRADIIETETRAKTAYEAIAKPPFMEFAKRVAEHREILSELQRRKASEWKLRRLMGLDEPNNQVAKREVLRQALEGHPARTRLEPLLGQDARHAAATAEYLRYRESRPGDAPETEFDVAGIDHLKVPEQQGSLAQFREKGLGGGHETSGLLAFVESNPNYWVVEVKTREHGGTRYRKYVQYTWDPAAGPPPPRPTGAKPGGPLPPGAGWVKSDEVKTTADDFHGFLGQVEAGLAAHRRANRPIPSMEQVKVSAGGARFIVVVAAGPPRRIVTVWPDAGWI